MKILILFLRYISELSTDQIILKRLNFKTGPSHSSEFTIVLFLKFFLYSFSAEILIIIRWIQTQFHHKIVLKKNRILKMYGVVEFV